MVFLNHLIFVLLRGNGGAAANRPKKGVMMEGEGGLGGLYSRKSSRSGTATHTQGVCLVGLGRLAVIGYRAIRRKAGISCVPGRVFQLLTPRGCCWPPA